MNDFDASDLEDLLNNPPPWPSSSDNLQELGPDQHLVAFPGHTIPMDPWYTYAAGYRLAANLIFREMETSKTSVDKEVLIYPFLMNWRHYIELQLKSLLAYMRSWSGTSSPNRRSHKLDRLWKDTRDLIKDSPHGLPGEVPDVERVILQLHGIDPTSQHSRYPMTTENTPAFEGVGPLDLGNFHRAMEAVANFLETLPDVMDEAYRFEAEMRAESYNDVYGY